ncbi:hypothetical protein LY76DRAFT_504464 [Colletotrichum caudatum]|nr:hypothetical protein LY76DRAFT_504464 [Colletotrichum caudatum]
MPINTSFALPEAADALVLPNSPGAAFFITFTTSDHPDTGESWCPDVRAALPHIKNAFSADGAPEMAFVESGRWKIPTNVFRTKWNVHNVPTIVRYRRIDGGIKETGRLVEAEILDEKRLTGLIAED